MIFYLSKTAKLFRGALTERSYALLVEQMEQLPKFALQTKDPYSGVPYHEENFIKFLESLQSCS